MREVRIEKDKLRQKVQENRDAHREIFERAFEGYTRAAIEFFEEQLERARDREQFMSFFQEPMPEDHTEDYDNVLEMLEMSEDRVITLSQQEFKQYVRDDWGWKREFIATSTNYIGS